MVLVGRTRLMPHATATTPTTIANHLPPLPLPLLTFFPCLGLPATGDIHSTFSLTAHAQLQQ